MPFTIRDVSKHTKKATTGRLRRQWVAVANSALESCRKKGGGKACDAKAITMANGVIAGQVSEGLLQEAATVKSQAQRLLRDITAILQDKELPEALRKEVEDVRAALRKTWSDLAANDENSEADSMPIPNLAEAAMKTVGGVKYPASDFLVAVDPESPDTWHLQIKKRGKVDRRLMGAAKAALTSPGGHRGQKYEGPDKSAAIAKLKALYKSEEMPWGEAEVDAGECYGEQPGPTPIYGATSFADLMAARQANDAAQQVRWLVNDFQNLVFACMGNPDVPDKLAAIRTITDEFMGLVEETLSEAGEDAECAECSSEFEDTGEALALARDATAEDTAALSEAETKVLGNGRRAPVVVEFQVLKPGPGNKKDNRYYPAETVERDIHVFQGVDVFATDHREAERSERTKVGKVLKVPTRFTSERAAVGEVLIYDPDQAEKARNRNDAHVLETLECSIFGTGRSRDGKVNGTTYKVVEALTEGLYLELVSKAGAGGHALSLAESEGGSSMEPKIKPAEAGAQSAPPAGAGPEAPAPVQEVAIAEGGTPATTPAAAPAVPAVLAEADVLRALNASALPATDRALLARITWKDAAELSEAITAQMAHVKELSGSGRPAGLGGAQAPAQPAELSEADRIKRFNVIMDEIGARPVPVPSGKGV